eukprot:g619.t1
MWSSEIQNILISGVIDLDANVRTNALEALLQFSRSDKNKESMWNSEVEQVLVIRGTDSDAEIRKKALRVLQNLACLNDDKECIEEKHELIDLTCSNRDKESLWISVKKHEVIDLSFDLALADKNRESMWNSEVKEVLIKGGTDSDAEVRKIALGALENLACVDKNMESMRSNTGLKWVLANALKDESLSSLSREIFNKLGMGEKTIQSTLKWYEKECLKKQREREKRELEEARLSRIASSKDLRSRMEDILKNVSDPRGTTFVNVEAQSLSFDALRACEKSLKKPIEAEVETMREYLKMPQKNQDDGEKTMNVDGIQLNRDNTLIIDLNLPTFDVLKQQNFHVKTYDKDGPKTFINAKDQILLYNEMLLNICVRILYVSIKNVWGAESSVEKSVVEVVVNGFCHDFGSGFKERLDLASVSQGYSDAKKMFSNINFTHNQFNINRFFEKLDGTFYGISHKKGARTKEGAVPYELPVPVKPVATIQPFEEGDEDYVEDKDVATNMNTGVNVAAMDPDDFEQLIRQVFLKYASKLLGDESDCVVGKATKVGTSAHSGDRGVDIVIKDRRPLVGQVIVVQAKCYTGTVGPEANLGSKDT